ncbi:MAG: hypothetical protein BGO86_00300 [Chryseobacterium sp. 36-9]|nr:MAG: hypothetical protein BGO86_00300 [Chryseobacterium sp. 36-9]
MLTPIPRQEIDDRIKEIENDKKAPLTISKRLNSPHSITINTKNWFESSDKIWNRKIKKEKYFHLLIDKIHLSRTLLILDFIVNLLEYRGHIFKIPDEKSTVIIMSGREIKMSIRTVGKYKEKVDLYRSRKSISTDILCLQMYEDTWNRKEWKDTPQVPLEDKLIRVIAYTELYAEYSHQYHLDIKEHWRQHDLLKEKEIEKQRKFEEEQKAVDELVITAENFDKSKKIENYLNERKNYLIRNNIFTDEEEIYFEWGMKQCQNLNPIDKPKNIT